MWRKFIAFSNIHCLHTFHRHALPVPGSTGHYHLKFRLIKDKQLYDLENKLIKTIKISGELYDLQALEAKSVQFPYNADKYHKLHKCLTFSYFPQWWSEQWKGKNCPFNKMVLKACTTTDRDVTYSGFLTHDLTDYSISYS